jgi:ubiquinone/menaquinone biosynthesis C-methylase UbiE
MKNIGTGEKILNLGCSDGYYDNFLAKKYKKVIGFEINEKDITIAKQNKLAKNIEYVLGNGKKLPFENNYFDTIICVDVLEHIKNDDALILEIYRVLSKNGTLIITTPHENFPFSYDPINWILKHFRIHLPIGLWGFGHFRLYTVKKLSEKLLSHKLKPIKVSYMLHFFCGIFENYYLVNIMQIFTKSDPNNQSKKSNKMMIKGLLEKEPPKLLQKIRDTIMNVDYLLSKKSKKSVGIMIVAKKCK